MSSANDRAKELFLDALDRPAVERQAFLADACVGDPTLLGEVQSLLSFHETGGEAPSGSASGADTSSSDRRVRSFAAGDLFAGRYRMVTRIGRGGMGEVWRADDLVLETPVALKLLYNTGAAARARILNEARLARQITHPSVCRVFDVGEADGEVFFSMELVRGEDLATLLRRILRLPPDKVADIARQLCAGLAAAHATGVLHRDLKPANVMINERGEVRITDFGIAISQTEAGDQPLVGTPEYMAPEQLVRGAPLSERTDLFALGVLLYELVTGRHPFNDRGTFDAPPRPSSMVPRIHPQLEKAILHAIAVEPRDRPRSAAALAEELPPPGDVPVVAGRSWRLWIASAAVAAIVAVGAAITWFAPARSAALSEQDTIVLADFTNTTGEPVFDRTLKIALAVALEQSPFLKVFPDDRVADTMRLMGRPPGTPITHALAREIAQREHLKALLSGSISALGQNYVVTLEAVNAETGDVMAREQVEAAGKEQVLTSLGSAASALRGRLGESLASIQKFDMPLPRATTASLEALNAYALALDEGRVNLRLDAIPRLQRAIELDPDFALAQAALAGVYANTGQTALAAPFARRAFELRDRVSERERYFVAFRYYRDATQDWEKALDLARQWTTAYPREAVAFNSLAISLLRFGNYEETLAPYREAIRLDPKFMPLYSNLAGSLMALERYDEAKAVLKQGEDLGIDYFSAHRTAYLLGLIEQNQPEMDRHVAAAMRFGQNNAAYGWRAHGLALHGQMAASNEHFRLGSEVALQAGFREVAAGLTIENLEGRALIGLCDDVRRGLTAALDWSRDNFSLERSSRALVLCGHEADGLRLMTELATRYPEATLVARISTPLGQALVALKRNEPRRALEVLDPVRPYDHAPWAGYFPAYLRGLAHLQLGNGADAVTEFQSIVSHRGEDPDSMLYPLAMLGLARAQAAAGQTAAAEKGYDEFLTLWKDADAELGVLKAARQERARLTPRSTARSAERSTERSE